MNLTQSIIDYSDNAGIKHNYPGPYVVTASPWLNVRQYPSISAKIIGKLTKGEVVMVLDRMGSWCQIEHGWIHDRIWRRHENHPIAWLSPYADTPTGRRSCWAS